MKFLKISKIEKLKTKKFHAKNSKWAQLWNFWQKLKTKWFQIWNDIRCLLAVRSSRWSEKKLKMKNKPRRTKFINHHQRCGTLVTLIWQTLSKTYLSTYFITWLKLTHLTKALFWLYTDDMVLKSINKLSSPWKHLTVELNFKRQLPHFKKMLLLIFKK